MALSLVRSDVSTMRLPSFTISPPMIDGSTFTSICTSFLVTALSASLIAARCASVGFSATVIVAVVSPLWLGDQRPEAADHVGRGEQPAVRRDDLEEARREPLDAGLVEHGRQRPGLLLGGEDRAAHQPLQIGTLGDQRVETVEIGFDRVDGMLFERQLEQCGGIASCHAGYDRFVACHVQFSSGQFRRLGAHTIGSASP